VLARLNAWRVGAMFDGDAGQACFVENVKLFGTDPVKAPEKFNLYKGLALLAKAIADLDTRLNELEAELSQLKHYLYYQPLSG
jgi:hypothetical protein